MVSLLNRPPSEEEGDGADRTLPRRQMGSLLTKSCCMRGAFGVGSSRLVQDRSLASRRLGGAGAMPMDVRGLLVGVVELAGEEPRFWCLSEGGETDHFNGGGGFTGSFTGDGGGASSR